LPWPFWAAEAPTGCAAVETAPASAIVAIERFCVEDRVERAGGGGRWRRAEGVAAVGGEGGGEEKSVERRGLRGGCNERDSDDKLAKTRTA
jgi:hypothetical protein